MIIRMDWKKSVRLLSSNMAIAKKSQHWLWRLFHGKNHLQMENDPTIVANCRTNDGTWWVKYMVH